MPATPPTLDEAMDSAHRHNPALAQAEKGIDVARAGVRMAKADSLPTIGAFAEATRTRDQFFPDYRADAMAVGIRGAGRSGPVGEPPPKSTRPTPCWTPPRRAHAMPGTD
jgi:outer membrane protein TolC